MMGKLDESGQAGALTDDIQITPEIIEAGLEELYENFRLGGDWRDLMERVYLAMALTSPQQRRSEISTI